MEKLLGPHFSVRLWEVSDSGGSTVSKYYIYEIIWNSITVKINILLLKIVG